MKQYYEEKITFEEIKKKALIAGTEILVSNLVDQSGSIDFDKLSNILGAYKDAIEEIEKNISYYKRQLEIYEGNAYNKEGGENNEGNHTDREGHALEDQDQGI